MKRISALLAALLSAVAGRLRCLMTNRRRPIWPETSG